MKRALLIFILLLNAVVPLLAQSQEEVIKNIFSEALTNGRGYEILEHLSNRIGGRLSGSPEAAAAVEYTRQVMLELDIDTVFLQPVMVPHWVRGDLEKGRIVNSRKMGSFEVNICALGNSIGTGPGGITAPVIEVKSFEELEELGERNIQGKMVFYNRPLDPSLVNTFAAYGGAVNQRGEGPSQAA